VRGHLLGGNVVAAQFKHRVKGLEVGGHCCFALSDCFTQFFYIIFLHFKLGYYIIIFLLSKPVY